MGENDELRCSPRYLSKRRCRNGRFARYVGGARNWRYPHHLGGASILGKIKEIAVIRWSTTGQRGNTEIHGNREYDEIFRKTVTMKITDIEIPILFFSIMKQKCQYLFSRNQNSDDLMRMFGVLGCWRVWRMKWFWKMIGIERTWFAGHITLTPLQYMVLSTRLT